VLVDDRGKRLGEIGPGEENADRFLAKICGHGAAPPDPPDPLAGVPARLLGPPFVCGRHRMS
jgi:hypothetical protein